MESFIFHPADSQAVELSCAFGCVRKVFNLAFAARAEAWTRQERVSCNATSAMLTAWKKTGGLVYLSEVFSVRLRQTLRHLPVAFTDFFGKRAKYPALHLAEEAVQERGVHDQRLPVPRRES